MLACPNTAACTRLMSQYCQPNTWELTVISPNQWKLKTLPLMPPLQLVQWMRRGQYTCTVHVQIGHRVHVCTAHASLLRWGVKRCDNDDEQWLSWSSRPHRKRREFMTTVTMSVTLVTMSVAAMESAMLVQSGWFYQTSDNLTDQRTVLNCSVLYYRLLALLTILNYTVL